jgi:ABC-type antimicrobial peptide transport system permease subunit
MGIRLALGAAPAAIRAMVLREGMAVAAIGIGGGVVAAVILTRYLKTLLYEVKPTDVAVYAAVCSVLAISAVAGCWLPARRATTVDPSAVLREE